MANFYYHADMMLLTLMDELVYAYTVPAKLQSYLASKKPVAAMINGEAADIIKRSKCGIVVNAEDYKAFAEEIIKISKAPGSYLDEMKQNGFAYYEKTFNKKFVIDSFLKSVSNQKNLWYNILKNNQIKLSKKVAVICDSKAYTYTNLWINP